MKVYLSPSTQYDNIYSGVSTSEAEVCYDIATYCEAALKRNGIDVKKGSRESSMESRVTESNNWGADYHIPIHTNAGGGKGTEVFAWHTCLDDALVKAVYNEVANLSPGSDRGIKNGDNLYEVNSTTAICCYIECEFHDTYGKWIYEHKKELGEAIAKGVITSAGKPFIESAAQTPSSKNLYRVQVGAFEKKENAETLKKELESKGYSVFISYGS